MITGANLLFLDQLLHLLNIESSIFQMTRAYLFIIICGMGFVFLYNYFTAVLRSMGNSFTPLTFFGDFVGDQYRIGLYICSSASDGSIRSSLCHGHRAGSIGSRNCSLYTVEGKRGKYFQADAKRRERIVLYDRESVTFDKRAAVDYEFRYFDGTGPGEQLRAFRHGRICRRGKNRLLRLYARAGFRQRILHLYRSKLRRQKRRSHSRGDLKARSSRSCFLPSHLHIGVPFCKAASLDFHTSRGI